MERASIEGGTEDTGHLDNSYYNEAYLNTNENEYEFVLG